MSVDWDRYADLQARATFAMNAYSGSFQDQSRNRLAMSAVGTPTCGQCGSVPILNTSATGAYVASAATTAIVDVTGTFTVEICGANALNASARSFSQFSFAAGGGFLVNRESSSAQGRYVLYLNSAIGGWVEVMYPAPTAFGAFNRTSHTIITSIAGGTSMLAWTNGTPVATSITSTGVAQNINAPASVVVGEYTGCMTLIARAYPFALTNEDAACLYGAAKSMVGEI